MTRNGNDTNVCASTTAVVVKAIWIPAAFKYCPIRPSRPYAYSSAIPPTTGGNTSGSRINGRIIRTALASLRASTRAIGTPRTRHRAVLAAAVRRLSSNADNDAALVINDQNRGQSTLAAIATNGTATKSAPSAAGM